MTRVANPLAWFPPAIVIIGLVFVALMTYDVARGYRCLECVKPFAVWPGVRCWECWRARRRVMRNRS